MKSVIAATACCLFMSMSVWGQTTFDAIKLFDETWNLVESHFLDPGLKGLDSAAIRAQARSELARVKDKEEAVRIVNSYLARLETSHTRLYCDQDPQYFELLDIFAQGPSETSIRARFEGELPSYVGILATLEGDLVVDVVPGGPAAQANLIPGDRVLGISDSEKGPFEPFHPIRSLQGKADQELYMEVQSGLVIGSRKIRPSLIQPHAAFLRSITDSAETVEMEGYRLGYLRVTSYASQDFHDALLELLAGPLSQTQGLVLDLRGGWGGASLEYLETFQPLPILEMTARDQVASRFLSGRWNRPVVMVVDERSRSGKELLAYAFQKQRLGLLVGSRTAGAVSAGSVYLLPDGCALYLAVARVAVNGHELEGRGVTPDIVLTEPTLPSGDPSVKEQALRLLLEEVKKVTFR